MKTSQGKLGKTEGEEEGEETELTSRERFDRFTHYVANIYGTTNGQTGKRGAWPGVDRVEGLRTDFRVVARASSSSSSTTRRVVKFEFATAKWATTTTTTTTKRGESRAKQKVKGRCKVTGRRVGSLRQCQGQSRHTNQIQLKTQRAFFNILRSIAEVDAAGRMRRRMRMCEYAAHAVVKPCGRVQPPPPPCCTLLRLIKGQRGVACQIICTLGKQFLIQ